MKHFIILFFVFFLIGTAIAQYDSIYVDGRWRTFKMHFPPSYEANQDTLYSLIMALHGGFGSAEKMEYLSQLSEKADTAAKPFIVVYPEGVKSPFDIRTWNAGNCCGYAMNHNIDDVHFISVLIDTLLNRYKIEEKRVYVTGMSNGGMMSYRLAAQLTCKIAAIAPVAATMVLDGPWTPSRPMPIIHFHSYLDEDVPYYGGVGNGVSDHYNPPVDSVLNEWSKLNGCAVRNDTIYHEVGEYLFKVWTQCNNNADIHLYVTYDGGHSWPGGEQNNPTADPPSEKINANDLMWAFFLDHPAVDETSTLSETSETLRKFVLYQNYPNPFNPITIICYRLSAPGFVDLAVFNLLGRKVRTLVNEYQTDGNHKVEFNASGLSSDIYFYKLTIGNQVHTRAMIILK